ncbi:MAG: SurA N-terminal domain-containing protein [Proteobacteria bacterium]|nr:SurA N-terminal domain-containing protein [Pseudomonadota bacterium]
MLTLLAALLFSSAHAATVDRVAAVVNDDVIALSEVYDLGDAFIRQSCPRLNPICVEEAEVQVLDSLIQRRLMRQELYRLGMQVTSEEIDRTIDQVGRDNGLTERGDLRREIERAGLTWEVYREQLTEQIRSMKFTESVIRPRIQVRESDVEERYRRATKDYEGPPTAAVEALALALPEDGGQEGLIEAVARARAIMTGVNAGEQDWKTAVAENDSGLYAPREGVMGDFHQGELMPALDAVVFGSEVGKVSEPVVVGSAVFLILVTEMRESDVLSYEQAAPKIREQLFNEKSERELEEWTASARRRAAVKVMLGDGSGSTEIKRVSAEEEAEVAPEVSKPAPEPAETAEPAGTPEPAETPEVSKPAPETLETPAGTSTLPPGKKAPATAGDDATDTTDEAGGTSEAAGGEPSTPAVTKPTEQAPSDGADGADVEAAPEATKPAEDAPTEAAPTEEAPTEEAPTEEAPTEEAPTDDAPAETDEEPAKEGPWSGDSPQDSEEGTGSEEDGGPWEGDPTEAPE